MNRRRIALRSFRDLCAFVGLIVLVSYFYNWTVDIRHWYVTLASAFVCLVLWLGFYVLEAHGHAVRCSSVPVKKSFPGAETRWRGPKASGRCRKAEERNRGGGATTRNCSICRRRGN